MCFLSRCCGSYCCMPQSLSDGSTEGDARTDAERRAFRLMLKNVNLLFLGMSVLILTDRSFLSRFWTNFEAWLAMQDVSMLGLVSARHALGRCTIRCVHGAPEALIESLLQEWSDCTAQKALDKLSSADVRVTNQADKDVQLSKILELDRRVADVAYSIGICREPSPEKPAARWKLASDEPKVKRTRTY